LKLLLLSLDIGRDTFLASLLNSTPLV